MPINTINFALASALLLMPPHYSVEQYQAKPHTLTVAELAPATEADFQQIADRILAANGTIEMFYRLAYADVRFFDNFPDGELAHRFAQTKQLLDDTQTYRHQLQALDDNLDLYCKNFQKLHRLYESYEYKKEADRVLLSRVDSPATTIIPAGSSRADIEQALFG